MNLMENETEIALKKNGKKKRNGINLNRFDGKWNGSS